MSRTQPRNPAPGLTGIGAILAGIAIALLLGGDSAVEWMRSMVHGLGLAAAWWIAGEWARRTLSGERWVAPWLTVPPLLMVAGFALLDIITATFFSGFVLLAVFLARSALAPGRVPVFRPWLVCCALVGAVLAVTPTTISRIDLNLDHLAVPSKFALAGDPGNHRPHNTSRGYPLHLLEPLQVTLSANNMRLHETLPVIELIPRRDTEFPFSSITYRFLHVPLLRLAGPALHPVQLVEDEQSITLVRRPRGLTVTDISGDEIARLVLPRLNPDSIPVSAHILAASLRLGIWLLGCAVFWAWTRVLRHREGLL